MNIKMTVIFALILMSISALSYNFLFKEEKTYSVSYYLEHKKERNTVIEKCDLLNPVEILSNANCMNASTAHSKDRMDHDMDGYKPSTHPGVPMRSYWKIYSETEFHLHKYLDAER